MRKEWFPGAVVISIVLVACGAEPVVKELKGTAVTDASIAKYLASYKAMKAAVPAAIEKANSGQAPDAAQEGFNIVEGACKENGLSYREFVMLNAKIGAIFSIVQGQGGMSELSDMKDAGMAASQAGIAQMQAQIDNPEVPEAAKVQLRKNIEEMRANMAKVETDWAKNKAWADLVMSGFEKLTGYVVNPEEAAAVKRNQAAIMETYAGMQPPRHTKADFEKMFKGEM